MRGEPASGTSQWHQPVAKPSPIASGLAVLASACTHRQASTTPSTSTPCRSPFPLAPCVRSASGTSCPRARTSGRRPSPTGADACIPWNGTSAKQPVSWLRSAWQRESSGTTCVRCRNSQQPSRHSARARGSNWPGPPITPSVRPPPPGDALPGFKPPRRPGSGCDPDASHGTSHGPPGRQGHRP